jgi:hypothetical protein
MFAIGGIDLIGQAMAHVCPRLDLSSIDTSIRGFSKRVIGTCAHRRQARAILAGGERPSLASPRMQRTDEKMSHIAPVRAAQLVGAQEANHALSCGQRTQRVWLWPYRQPIT